MNLASLIASGWRGRSCITASMLAIGQINMFLMGAGILFCVRGTHWTGRNPLLLMIIIMMMEKRKKQPGRHIRMDLFSESIHPSLSLSLALPFCRKQSMHMLVVWP